jgi:hypothetical protein
MIAGVIIRVETQRDTPAAQRGRQSKGERPMRHQDGLDMPTSPNGPTARFYVTTQRGERRGPYGCLAEAVENTETEYDRIEDSTGAAVEDWASQVY